MNILFLLEDTTPTDEFRYVQTLINSINENDITMQVAFVGGGAPADLAYQLMKEQVVNKLSFKAQKPTYCSLLAKYIDQVGVDVVVTSRAYFEGEGKKHNISEVLDKCKGSPKVIFVGHDCSSVVTEHAQALSQYNPFYVAVSCLVAERFMKPFDPLVIYGAAVMPQSSDTDIRKHYGINPKMKLFGYIGNLDLIDTDIVVEAVKRMGGGLIVCGTGQKLSALSEVKGPIKVMPIMPEARADWYRAFTCFLYPVRQAGFPSLPLESILCGTPVAMTPVSDFYALFKGNIGFGGLSTGELVDAVDRTKSIDWKRTAGLVENEFSVERMVGGWYSVLG